jgi:hypothetical protein
MVESLESKLFVTAIVEVCTRCLFFLELMYSIGTFMDLSSDLFSAIIHPVLFAHLICFKMYSYQHSRLSLPLKNGKS